MTAGLPLAHLGSVREPDLAGSSQRWLDRFEHAWRTNDRDGIEALFAADGHWRDCVAVSGTIRTVSGSATIADTLCGMPAANGFRVTSTRTRPRVVLRAGRQVVETIFEFEAAWGPASGVLRLVEGGSGGPAVVWVFHTSLDGLHVRPGGGTVRRDDPTVVVVGAGHAGLGAAAYLRGLGIETAVIDRLPRVGDVWRNRYDSLVLHNESRIDQMPYLPFESPTPRFLSRDFIADWLEKYAAAMDVDVSTDTELVSADRTDDLWSIKVNQHGKPRVLHPRHLVLAIGVNSTPVLPDEPGLDEFTGTVMHAGEYRSGAPFAGRRAVVLGSGSSAHDIAQDLHRHGAAVTMVQRGPTLVVSLEQAQRVYTLYAEPLPLADRDLLSAATPYPVLVRAHQAMAAAARSADRDLLEALARRGFRLDDGAPDASGYLIRLLRRGGGYYVNVGCSELIASGRIGLLQHDRIDRFTATGLQLTDGSVVPADLIVAGTGYRRPQDFVRRHLGSEVADRVGAVSGVDEAGEQRNMWRPTAQPGLWFTGGGFPQARVYARFLALQIAAKERGFPEPQARR